MTPEDLVRTLRAAGMTTSDIRQAEAMAALPAAAIPLIVRASVEARDRASKRVARRLWARAPRTEQRRSHARQNDQINPSTTIPTTPGTGSRPQLASMLREGRKSANIQSHLGNPG
jgi:hypothetical protein